MKASLLTLTVAALAALLVAKASWAGDCTLVSNGQTRPEGTLIYNSSAKTVQFCNGTQWVAARGTPGPPGPPGDLWGQNGSAIYYNSGNVGIGTGSPVDALQIGDGSTVSNLNIPNGGVCIDADGACTAPGAGGLRVGTAGIYGTNSSGDDLYLVPTVGNVGIGTTDPLSKLHVAGTGKFTGALDLSNQNIVNLGTPTAAAHAATKAYVDGVTGANETDPQVNAVTNGQWCRGTGTQVTCDQSAPLTSETDPQVSAVTNGQWCRGTGTQVTCDQAAPVTSESDPQVGTLTNARWCTSDGSTVNCTTVAPVTAEADPQVNAVTNGQWCRGTGTQVTCDSAPTLTCVDRSASASNTNTVTVQCQAGERVTGGGGTCTEQVAMRGLRPVSNGYDVSYVANCVTVTAYATCCRNN